MKSLSRRTFLGSSTFLSFAGVLGVWPLLGATSSKKPKGNFVHHVYFWLNNPDSDADKAKLIEGLNALKAIKQIRLARIGVPASTNRDVIEKGYDVSWLLFFDNLEQEEEYQKHPIHLKFVKDYSHLWSKVIVYDSVDV